MCLKCSKQKPAYASRLVQLAVLGGGNPDTKTFKQCQTNQEDHLSKVFGLEVPVNKCNIFSGISQLFFTIPPNRLDKLCKHPRGQLLMPE